MKYNPKYDELFAPVVGPSNPFKTQQQAAHKNHLGGFVEDAHVNEFQFETQRRTFQSYKYAYDPSATDSSEGDKLIGSESSANEAEFKTVFEDNKKRPLGTVYDTYQYPIYQCCGSRSNISSESGPAPDMDIRYGSRALITENWKNKAEFFVFKKKKNLQKTAM